MPIKRNRLKILCILVTIILGVLLGWHTLATPSPRGAQEDGLSAYRMEDHLQIIAAEERSVFHYERRMYVRDYIIDFMENLGLTAEIDNFTATTEDIAQALYEFFGVRVGDFFFSPERRNVTMYGSNVLFRQQGSSDTAIMLMAHIDSAGVDHSLRRLSDVRSPGASDAGYGLSLMLELAEYFAGRELENSIYFFFTDLHEIGLLGARHAAQTMDFANVSMILNIDARGIRGPVYMFETNAGDLETMRFFRDAVSAPLAYSIASIAYRNLPHDTDLTPFLDRGFAGMNFAPINNLLYYHTEYDSLENISLTTMQHYVDQIGALVELFVTDSRFSDVNLFESERTGVYFTLPFGILILYSDQLATVIGVILLLLVGVVFVIHNKKKQVKLWKVIGWLCILVGALLMSVLIGLGISLVVARVTGIPFNLISMILPYTEMLIMWPSVGILFVLFGLFHKLMKKFFNPNEMVIGAMMLLATINIVFVVVLVEATFFTTVPLGVTLFCFL